MSVAREQKKDRANALRVVGLALAVGTLLWTFRDSEPERIVLLLKRVGGAGVLILLPQCLSLLVESWGWRLVAVG